MIMKLGRNMACPNMFPLSKALCCDNVISRGKYVIIPKQSSSWIRHLGFLDIL